MSTILVVDDTPDNLTLMSGLLKDLYRVKVANGGERGGTQAWARVNCMTSMFPARKPASE